MIGSRASQLYKLLFVFIGIYVLYVLIQNFIIDPQAEHFRSFKTVFSDMYDPEVWLIVMRIHIVTATIAWIAGALNFSTNLLKRRRNLHRVLGYLFIVCVVLTVITSGYMAPNATGGKISSYGFNLMNILWLTLTITALVQIRKGNVIKHRKWMIRSYMFTFTNFFIHFILFAGHTVGGLDYVSTYQFAVYASIFLNLFIAEWINLTLFRKPPGVASRRKSSDLIPNKVDAKPITKGKHAAAVEFSGVYKYYGNLAAVNGISFRIEPGSVIALLGPNGAGKTTTINMMLGLLEPSVGQVGLMGEDPVKPRNRIHLGAMLQDIGAPETLKVRELIELWSAYYPKPLSLAEVLEISDLKSIKDRRFGQLSGGQKRKVAFALAVCGDPDILFLDEPSVGMDIDARRMLWEKIRSFANSGKTVIFSTHHLEEADALAERIILMKQGKVLFDATPKAMKARLEGKVIQCMTNLKQDKLLAIPHVTGVTVQGQSIRVSTSNAEMSLRRILEADPSISDLTVTAAGLDDVFTAMIKGDEMR